MTVWKSWAALMMSSLAGGVLAGCLQSQIDQDNRQLQQQNAELQRLDEQLAALKASSAASTPIPAGACDMDLSRAASRRGGERFAAADFSHALSYYQDALTACPNSARAELNVARAYEALGQLSDAITHYRNAARGGGEDGDATAQQARNALTRMGAR